MEIYNPNRYNVRELYKYDWIRLLPPDDKKVGLLPQKVWAIFCVHRGKVPFLEIYYEKPSITIHKPNMYYNLMNVLHVTPSICPIEGEEYEFFITSKEEVLRLIAPTWNKMKSWVDVLNNKLRELNVLPSKENPYCLHSPVHRQALLPTRDPNSPLPQPPPITYIPPGVEPVPTAQSETTEDSDSSPVLTPTIIATPQPDGETTSNSAENEEIAAILMTNPRYINRTIIRVSAQDPSFDMFDLNSINEVIHQMRESEPNSVNSTVPVSITGSYTFAFTEPVDQFPYNEEIGQNHSPITIEPVQNGDVIQSESNGSETAQLNSSSESPGLYEHVFLPPDNQILSIPNMQYSPNSSQLPRMGRGNLRGVRRRNNSSGEGNSSFTAMAADRIRSPGFPSASAQCLNQPPHPFRRQVNNGDATNKCTLREQQVMQLHKEMAHSAGVRLHLRRRDCVGSIAFIDAFQTVWIAGWKQKEYPMLYNALHIGDQILSIGGKRVTNASDAQKFIKLWPSLYIEFVIRRVPLGRVFVLRRECEGQSLGVVQEGNTADIKEITPNSIAAKHGLPARTSTADGKSLTMWALTEINGRPLNLFFKDNEIKDRLNAVGLEISLLVQPSDLIKQIKKQLKCIKNYKEYLVQ